MSQKEFLFFLTKKVIQERILRSIKNPDQYFDICDAVFLARNCPIADITPIYCSLEKQTLLRIREGLIKKGFAVRVLFIARDPFSRMWSMHRMGIKRRLRRHPEQTWRTRPENAHKNFLEAHLNDFQQVRSRYEKILPNLFDVLLPDEIGIFFYENLFSMDTYSSLCNFCACHHQHPPSIVFVMGPRLHHSHPSIFKELLSILIRKHMNT